MIDNGCNMVDKKYKTQYNDWLLYEHKKRIFQINNPMFEFIGKNLDPIYNSLHREYASTYLKKCIWVDINTIITTFKLRDTSEPLSNAIIYAFLYSTVNNTQGKKSKQLKNTYFCCGPSLLSRDGEYRQRLTSYESLKIIIKKYSILWDSLEEYMLNKIKKLPWNYYAEYFFPTVKQQKYEASLISNINVKRLPIKFLIISWFTELFNIINKMPVNHTNKLYLKTIGLSNTNVLKQDKEFYKKIVNEFGEVTIFNLRHDLNRDF